MYPQDPNQTNDRHSIHNPLSVMEPGERTICEIKRHPIGMLGIYIVTGLLLLVLAVIVFVVLPRVLSSESQSQVTVIGGLVFIVFAVLSLGFVFVTNKVYWGNSWVVTSDSITQITQTGLFDKQSSQLSLADLEDITAEQDGVLAQMFHYGVISAETAAATDKFTFIYCPNPNYYAQQILSAREQFKQNRRGDDLQHPYSAEGTYQQPTGQPYPNNNPGQNVNPDTEQ
jgi:hypothetical protein